MIEHVIYESEEAFFADEVNQALINDNFHNPPPLWMDGSPVQRMECIVRQRFGPDALVEPYEYMEQEYYVLKGERIIHGIAYPCSIKVDKDTEGAEPKIPSKKEGHRVKVRFKNQTEYTKWLLKYG